MLVKLILVLSNLIREILLSILDLFAQLLDILCGLSVLNHLTARPDHIYILTMVHILAHVSEYRQAC